MSQIKRTEQLITKFIAIPLQIDMTRVDYQEAVALAEIVYSKISPIRERFIEACLGNPYKNINSYSLSFPDRFLKQPIKFDNAKATELRQLIEDSFDLGLFFHLICQQFPSRNTINDVNIEELFLSWAPDSIIADSLSRNYNSGNGGMPSKVEKSYFNSEVELILKQSFNIGFWKRSMARSWFKNTYFAGIHLGLMYDLAINPNG